MPHDTTFFAIFGMLFYIEDKAEEANDDDKAEEE